jgi:hypothetical protein
MPERIRHRMTIDRDATINLPDIPIRMKARIPDKLRAGLSMH